MKRKDSLMIYSFASAKYTKREEIGTPKNVQELFL